MLSKQEIKAVCLPIFDRLNLKKSDQSEFISELLEHASRWRKVCRQQRKSFKKQGDILPHLQQIVLLQVTILRQKMETEKEEVSDIDLEVWGADLAQCLRLGGKVSLKVVLLRNQKKLIWLWRWNGQQLS